MGMNTPLIRILTQRGEYSQTALFILLMLFMSGCMKVETDAQPLIHQAHEEIAALTHQNPLWPPTSPTTGKISHLEELLKNKLTCEKVVHIALLNNPTLQAVYESLGIAQANRAQAVLTMNPALLFSYRFSTEAKATSLIDIDLFQNFVELLLIPMKKKMAQEALEAAKARLMSYILEIMGSTQIAFYTLQAVEESFLLKKQILLATELSYEAAQRLFEAGNIQKEFLLRERLLYEQAKLDVASWEIAVLDAREQLHTLMGLWGRHIEWQLMGSLPSVPSEKDDFSLIENEAIRTSIDLKAAYKELISHAAGYGIDTSRLIFPQGELGIGSKREEGVWYIGPSLSLSIPFFDWGKVQSAKAQSELMREWHHFTALALHIRSKARAARFSLLNALRQFRYVENVILPLAEQFTHFVLLQHNAMQLGIFDLLEAKKVELEKKLQNIQLKKEYWISHVTLHTLLHGHVLEASGHTPYQRPNHE